MSNTPQKPVKLALKHIVTAGGTQPRDKISEATVEEYAAAMKEGDEFPPIKVFNDGSTNWLAGGFHRYFAAQRAGLTHFQALIFQGTKSEARFFALGDNRDNGRRLSNADKRAAVLEILNNPDRAEMSNRAIARHIGVSDVFVLNLRRELAGDTNAPSPSQPPIFPPPQPPAPLVNDDVFEDEPSKEGANISTLDTFDTNSDSPTSAPKMREVGHIAADGKLVETPAPTSDPTKNQPSPDELSDEEWCASLPLDKALEPFLHSRAIFRADALAYRALGQSGLLGSLKHRAHAIARFTDNSAPSRGPLTEMMARLAALKSPTEWKICPSCAGSGQYWMGNNSKSHLEPGTVTPNESNDLKNRATLVACDKCKGGYSLE